MGNKILSSKMLRTKKKNVLKLKEANENKKLTYYSLMNLPYSNFFYAKNCLKHLAEISLKIEHIINNTKIEEIKDKDLEELNSLLDTIGYTSKHIDNYFRNNKESI